MARIAVAAGHSTNATRDQVWEHHRCKAVASVLIHLLDQAGVGVEPAPEGVYGLPNDDALKAKVLHFNEHGPFDLVLELHANAGGGTYSTAIYWDDGKTFSDNGRQAAHAICDQWKAALPWKGIGPRGQSYFHRDLYLLNKTRAPAVITEPCFYDDPTQRAWLQSQAGAVTYATTVATGVLRWLQDDQA